MNIRQFVARNTLVQLLGYAVDVLIGVAMISALARYLGIVSFGKYAFISAFFYFFLTFVGMGIAPIAVREISKERNRADEIMGAVISLKIFLGIIAVLSAVLIINIFNFPQNIKWPLYIYSGVLVFFALDVLAVIFDVELKLEYAVAANIIWRVTSFLFIILSIRMGLGLSWIMGCFLIAEALKFSAIFIFSRRFVRPRLKMDTGIWKKFIIASIPIALTAFFTSMIDRVDVIMLTKLRSFYEVGFYNVASRIVNLFYAIPAAFSASIFPLMSRFGVADKERLKRIFQKSTLLLAAAGIPLAIGLYSVGGRIILYLFGADYVAAVPALRILIWCITLIFMSFAGSTLLVSAGLQKQNMAIVFITALVNLLLNFVFIPWFGFIGAALTSLVSYAFLFIATIYVIKRKLNFALPFLKLLMALAAGLVTITFVYCFKKTNEVILAVSAAALYFSIISLTNVFSKKDFLLLFEKE